MRARRGGTAKAAGASKVEAPGARRPGPTVAVHHPLDPNRPTVIPKADFDPKVHTLWREPGEPEADASQDTPASADADEANDEDPEDESGSSVR